MKRKIIILIILAALAGGGVLVWRRHSQGSQEPAYTTAEVRRGTIVATVSASGNLLPTNTFTVTTAVTGVVKNVFVKDGQQVVKGQPLVEITPDQDSETAMVKAYSTYLSTKDAVTAAEQNKLTLEKGVADAQNKLIVAQQNAEVGEEWDPTDPEKQKLNADRRSAELSLELAQRKHQQADAAIEKAQTDLDAAAVAYQLALPIIVAPQTGKISDIAVAPGMLVTEATQKLLTIVGEQQPLLFVSVNEIDIGQIAADQKATITFDALTDKTFTGKVVGIDRSGTATQGVVTYTVLIQLNTGAEQVYANMSGTAEIIISAKENVLWVPPSVIRTQAGQTIVRVLANGQVREKQVAVGLETSDRVEILSGLAEGEAVIVSEQTGGGQAPSFGGEGGFRMMMR